MFEDTMTGDEALIEYDERTVPATIEAIKFNADKTVRLFGLRPDGTDHVAWFSPQNGPYGSRSLRSVGGSTVAFV